MKLAEFHKSPEGKTLVATLDRSKPARPLKKEKKTSFSFYIYPQDVLSGLTVKQRTRSRYFKAYPTKEENEELSRELRCSKERIGRK